MYVSEVKGGGKGMVKNFLSHLFTINLRETRCIDDRTNCKSFTLAVPEETAGGYIIVILRRDYIEMKSQKLENGKVTKRRFIIHSSFRHL